MNWDKFNQYVGIPGVLAIFMTIAMVGWLSFSMTVPAEAWGLLGLAWGFYFRGEGKAIASSTLRK